MPRLCVRPVRPTATSNVDRIAGPRLGARASRSDAAFRLRPRRTVQRPALESHRTTGDGEAIDKPCGPDRLSRL
ncbi:MAG TPA: hypothetical protein DCQ98_15335 [Planctomycetaceae bacterium]|nr:hypothetical protein [Planctomycetaceae bacterium]